LFNASDYNLYSYNINTGAKDWSYNLRYKSDLPARFVNDAVWANGGNGAVQINRLTGEWIKNLPFESIQSEPLIRNGILYATGIVDGGAAFAYDLANDTIVWQIFIAHGCARQPYYFEDFLIANGEGDNWLDIKYDGTLRAPGCVTQDHQFPSELPCVRKFEALTHDNKEINGMFGESFDGGSFRIPAVHHFNKQTFLFYEGVLNILGSKKKKKLSMDLKEEIEESEYAYNTLQQILKVDDKNAWLLYDNKIFVFDYKKKKTIKTVDLSKWQPKQVEMHGEKVWLISGEDGRLYGIQYP
jgi:hypothetical protein